VRRCGLPLRAPATIGSCILSSSARNCTIRRQLEPHHPCCSIRPLLSPFPVPPSPSLSVPPAAAATAATARVLRRLQRSQHGAHARTPAARIYVALRMQHAGPPRACTALLAWYSNHGQNGLDSDRSGSSMHDLRSEMRSDSIESTACMQNFS
jgi:hypothetical protein